MLVLLGISKVGFRIYYDLALLGIYFPFEVFSSVSVVILFPRRERKWAEPAGQHVSEGARAAGRWQTGGGRPGDRGGSWSVFFCKHAEYMNWVSRSLQCGLNRSIATAGSLSRLIVNELLQVLLLPLLLLSSRHLKFVFVCFCVFNLRRGKTLTD